MAGYNYDYDRHLIDQIVDYNEDTREYMVQWMPTDNHSIRDLIGCKTTVRKYHRKHKLPMPKFPMVDDNDDEDEKMHYNFEIKDIDYDLVSQTYSFSWKPIWVHEDLKCKSKIREFKRSPEWKSRQLIAEQNQMEDQENQIEEHEHEIEEQENDNDAEDGNENAVPNYYQCKICDTKIHKKKNVRRHMKTHEDKEKFKCDTCGKEYTREDNLKAHQIVHKDVKCSICSKSFNRKADLDRHLKSHDASNKIKCLKIEKLFSRKDSMLRHSKKCN